MNIRNERIDSTSNFATFFFLQKNYKNENKSNSHFSLRAPSWGVRASTALCGTKEVVGNITGINCTWAGITGWKKLVREVLLQLNQIKYTDEVVFF